MGAVKAQQRAQSARSSGRTHRAMRSAGGRNDSASEVASFVSKFREDSVKVKSLTKLLTVTHTVVSCHGPLILIVVLVVCVCIVCCMSYV